MAYGEQYFCWKYNKVLKHPTIICTQFKNPKGRAIATPLEFLDIPMGQKYPFTLNPKAASLMINKTKVLPCLSYGFCRIFISFHHHILTPPPPFILTLSLLHWLTAFPFNLNFPCIHLHVSDSPIHHWYTVVFLLSIMWNTIICT